MSKLNIAFGQRLKELRKKKKWSLLELSIRADINHNYLSDLENGRRNPSLMILDKLAMSFNITLSELLFGVELLLNTDNR